MKTFDLELCEGQQGRLVFTITAPPGTDTTLRGAVFADPKELVPLPMVAEGENALVIPATQAGYHHYEVRAGGATILYGVLRTLPSPLVPPGAAGWDINVDMTQELPHVDVGLLQGPQGPQGEPGASAYEAAVAAGYEGTEEEFNAAMAALPQDAAAAAQSAADAAASQEAAAGSAQAAAAYAEAASGSAAAAADSASTASAQAGVATAQATAAAESAETATTQATAAEQSATAAAGSATDAGNSATAAAGSASDAAASASDAATDAATATAQATEATTQAGNAAASATTASQQATAAGNSASAAAGSATTAGTKATEAAGSATTASTKATEAANSASAAAQSAEDAAESAELLGDAALQGNNNTFTQTNTFNGAVALNGSTSVTDELVSINGSRITSDELSVLNTAIGYLMQQTTSVPAWFRAANGIDFEKVSWLASWSFSNVVSMNGTFNNVKNCKVSLPNATFENLTEIIRGDVYGAFVFFNSQNASISLPKATFAKLKNANRLFCGTYAQDTLELPEATFASYEGGASSNEIFFMGYQPSSTSPDKFLSISLPKATFASYKGGRLCTGGSGGSKGGINFSAPIALFDNPGDFKEMFNWVLGTINLPAATFENATSIQGAFALSGTYVRVSELELPSATFANVVNASSAFSGSKGGISLPLATFEKCSNFASCFSLPASVVATGILNVPNINMESCTNAASFSMGQRMNLATLRAVSGSIATAPATGNTIVLGIDGILETDPEAQAAVQAIRDKGWDVTAEWNTPAN